MREDLIFDIGMHRGEDTDFYLKKGYQVVGIEANPALAEHCRRRFATRVADGSLRIIEGAIVGTDRLDTRSVKFYENPNSAWGTIDPEWRDRNAQLGLSSREIEVPCVDLAAILKEYGIPFYMKIDIEGADRSCLDYLKSLDDHPQYLSIEDEKLDFSRLLSNLAVLQQLGYSNFRAVQQEAIPNSVFSGSDRFGRPITHRFEDGASGVFGTDLPGPWMSAQELIVEYKWIFEMYLIFGDNSPMTRLANLNALRAQLAHHVQRCLPGWYDTHASR
jgi:FkbM family methyltransferase